MFGSRSVRVRCLSFLGFQSVGHVREVKRTEHEEAKYLCQSLWIENFVIFFILFFFSPPQCFSLMYVFVCRNKTNRSADSVILVVRTSKSRLESNLLVRPNRRPLRDFADFWKLRDLPRSLKFFDIAADFPQIWGQDVT